MAKQKLTVNRTYMYIRQIFIDHDAKFIRNMIHSGTNICFDIATLQCTNCTYFCWFLCSLKRFHFLTINACCPAIVACMKGSQLAVSCWYEAYSSMTGIEPLIEMFVGCSFDKSTRENYCILVSRGAAQLAIGAVHRLNMVNIQSLFELLCTAVLIGWDPATPPPPPSFGLIYEGAIGQPR